MRSLPEETPDDVRAVLERVIPDDSAIQGYVMLVTYVEIDSGTNRYCKVTNVELPISQVIGLLIMAVRDYLEGSERD